LNENGYCVGLVYLDFLNIFDVMLQSIFIKALWRHKINRTRITKNETFIWNDDKKKSSINRRYENL